MDGTNNYKEMTGEAWRMYRNETRLSQVSLAKTSLVSACALKGDDPNAHRRFGVRALLLWALMQLEETKLQTRQRQAEVLGLRYVDGLTVSEVINELGRPGSTVKTQQRKGIESTAKILAEETIQQRGVGWYRPKSIELRIAACNPNERKLLQFLAIFRKPVPLRIGLLDERLIFQPHIRTLAQANLLWQEDDGLFMQSEVRNVVVELTSISDLFEYHAVAARFYKQEGAVGEAIYHWQKAGCQPDAAKLLLEKAAQLGAQEGLALLTNFERDKLPDRDIWARLQLLRGQLVEQSQQLDMAISVYEDALDADDVKIQAEACHRLARVYQRRDVTVALIHYASAVESLQGQMAETARQLLAEVHISRAWIYVDRLFDEGKVSDDLQAAEQILADTPDSETWLQLRSDWHNVWGGFYRLKGAYPQSQHERRQAWLLARQAGDVTRTINTGYNLGVVYGGMEMFAEAYRFLLESIGLAQEAGDERMVALCNKELGGCYVRDGEQYVEAVPLYQAAYAFFKQTGNQFWLAATCYDLAEALIAIGEMPEALAFLNEGMATVEAGTRLEEAFNSLQKKYIELSAELTPRQRDIIHYARTHNGIKKRICGDLLDISDRQALRELNTLIKRNLLQRTGNGRATQYMVK